MREHRAKKTQRMRDRENEITENLMNKLYNSLINIDYVLNGNRQKKR